MTFAEFFIIIFMDVIIISLAVETKLYSNIIISIKKIFPIIKIAFIILAPLFTMSVLISICNVICLKNSELYITQVVNEYSNGIMEFGINLITHSPLFFLVLCLIIQSDTEIMDEVNIVYLEKEYKKIAISIVFNYIALTILIIYIIIDVFHTKNNFPIKFIQYIKDFKFSVIINDLENTICIVLIFVLGITYYIGIFLIPRHYIEKVLNLIIEKNKKWKYKILIFVPLVNIYIVYVLNKKIVNESRKNGT
jgi:hypothetical protein